MGQKVSLTAADGHSFDAYRTDPEGAPRGSLIVVQEVFGVNRHIRAVADGYAKEGYLALAPAYFDRVEKNVELAYQSDDYEMGRSLVGKLGWDGPIADTRAAADYLRREAGDRVGCVGYCWGGSLAWLVSARIGVPSVGYYGGRTAGLIGETPQAPILLFFGEKDASTPPEDIAKIRAAHPDVPIHMFPAGHGFNCDLRADYHADSAAAARETALAFFAEHVG